MPRSRRFSTLAVGAAPPPPRRRTDAIPSGRRRAHRQGGQSVVEFALVLLPLMLVLLGIIQMGLVLNAYVTMSNASREGGRAASIYVYDRNLSKSDNDAGRLTAVRTAVTNSMGTLSKVSPQFATSDLAVTYATPAGVSDSDARASQDVTVRVTYHLDLIVPLISNLLPRDASGRLPVGAEVTMVVQG